MHYNSVSTVSGFALNITASGSGNNVGEHPPQQYRLCTLSHGAPFSQAHHDLLWAPAQLAFWEAPQRPARLQAATGQFGSSLSVDPLFVDDFNGLPCSQTPPADRGSRWDYPMITDGDARSLPGRFSADLGADGIDLDCTLLAGTYVIPVLRWVPISRRSPGRWTASSGAASTGPVVFEVENGTYTEQLRIAPIEEPAS